MILSRVWVTKDWVRIVLGFVINLQVVTTFNTQFTIIPH
jgi:hypothetical protein